MSISIPRGRLPIRVGLAGVGNWARHGHLRVLELLPDYEISAVYSQRAEAARQAAQEHRIPHVAGTLADLVSHPEVDLVAVLTTAPQHADAVGTAIGAGRDVYCEWPLTTGTATSEALLDLARSRGARHVVGLQRRLAPHNRYLRDLLTQGFVGRLRSVRLHVSVSYFQARRANALRWTIPPENLSSVVAIYAGHFLDMLFAATGWPDEISALSVNQFPVVTLAETGETFRTTSPDQLVLIGRIGDSAVLSVQIEGGKRSGSGVQIDVTGDEGDIRITNTSAFGDVGDDYVITGARGDNQPLSPMMVPAGYSRLPPSTLPSAVLELAELYAAHADDVRNGTQLAPTFQDAVRMHRLLDAVAGSTHSGGRVAL